MQTAIESLAQPELHVSLLKGCYINILKQMKLCFPCIFLGDFVGVNICI